MVPVALSVSEVSERVLRLDDVVLFRRCRFLRTIAMNIPQHIGKKLKTRVRI
jgi:hypothetical protein